MTRELCHRWPRRLRQFYLVGMAQPPWPVIRLPMLSPTEVRERYDWIVTHGRGMWAAGLITNVQPPLHAFYFENPVDAVYFKLRWYDVAH